MKGIYLAAYKAIHPNYDIVYQGGYNVHNVIEVFLDTLKNCYI